ncbi:LapD/MoxY N-terminal periplasmic domain-containing protein [Pantoea sp. 18069]|uniref:bifunctional diguanylate cyclase/phosphodiesterase n=1 Tax=Pantoea sp. 18069 TaxID=2681415 RepID=UPI00190F2367|nr:LapD/MoxY N-terminal periplasmic domain-containing protein [Pantoea sp. 18069]
MKQLLISVTVAIVAILIGTLAFSIGAARAYLDGQLQSEGENAASSLALTLSQPANQDPVTRELLMMALFDSGQFRLIRLTSPQGQTLFERKRGAGDGATPSRERTPPWFVAALPLHQATAERVISDGWTQVGQLTLEVEDSYAREALWRSSVRMATLVVVAGLAWALFVVLLLQWFRKVLQREIAAQVQAIDAGSGAHAAATDRSIVAELMPVVRAIADTRERVQATSMEQMARIESLELEVNRDPGTQLPNRKYFVNELRRALSGDAGRVAHGYVMLFRQWDLLALNAQMSRASADAWLASVVEHVGQVLTDQAEGGPQLARLNGSDFVVLMPALAGPQAMSLVQQIRQVLLSMRVRLAGGQWCRWSFALTDYSSSSSVTGVLSRLDYGLMRAESSGQAEVEFVAYGDDEVVSNMAGETLWRQMLIEALEAPGRLSLAVQPLVLGSAERTQLRSEASLTLSAPSGETLMGSLFLPVAVRLGLSADFDLRAVALGLVWLEQHADAELVVRISLPSLAQPDFLARLREALQTAPGLQRLCLELDAHGLVACPQEVTEFCGAMAQAGAAVGLRRLDQQPMALAHLHALALRYVKLGGDFAEQSWQSPGALHLLQAMLQTAATLGVQVVVTDSVNGETLRMLHAHGVLTPAI